jgi:carbon-monoxide dehydrogenase small subunit
VVTIEGLAADARADALRAAFVEHGAVQCGYCTPGFVMQASHLLATHPDADAEAIKRGIEGNLCRCTGYKKIVEAIASASEATRAGARP